MDLEAEVVAQVDEPGQVRLEEAAEQGLADDRPVLGAEVVADEKDVESIGRGLEDAQARLEVVIDDARDSRISTRAGFSTIAIMKLSIPRRSMASW